MTPKLLAVAALAGTLPLAVPAPLPAPVPAMPKTEFERYWDFAQELGKRKNGARLTAKVKEHTAETLVLEWSIDYDGPRDPLVIITPTYDKGATLMPRQADFQFNAEGSDGKVYQQYHANVPRTKEGMLIGTAGQHMSREYYLTIPKGKPATGTAVAPFKKMVEGFKRDFPEVMAKPPKNMYVVFCHGPYDRAEHINLDAWTGNLFSGPVRLEPKGW